MFHRLGSALGVLATALEVHAGLGHALLVFRPLHALIEFVHLFHETGLFLHEALEATSDVFLLFLGLGGLKCVLKLLEALVDVLLPAGEVTKTAESLQVFLLLLILFLVRGEALGLVFALLHLHLKLVELLLVAPVLTGLALLLLLLAPNLMLAGGKFEEGLEGDFLRAHGVIQFFAIVPGLLREFLGLLDHVDDLLGGFLVFLGFLF